MRRPQMDPQEADATVRGRTVQGMARGRVPSAHPVPRQRVPRILGGLRGGGPTAPLLCTTPGNGGFTLTSSTDTSALFDSMSGFGYVSLSVRVNYDCTYTGTVTPEVRVYRSGAWTSWTATSPTTISGPDLAGTVEAWLSGGDNITAIEVRWDMPDAFTALCVDAIDNS